MFSNPSAISIDDVQCRATCSWRRLSASDCREFEGEGNIKLRTKSFSVTINREIGRVGLWLSHSKETVLPGGILRRSSRDERPPQMIVRRSSGRYSFSTESYVSAFVFPCVRILSDPTPVHCLFGKSFRHGRALSIAFCGSSGITFPMSTSNPSSMRKSRRRSQFQGRRYSREPSRAQ